MGLLVALLGIIFKNRNKLIHFKHLHTLLFFFKLTGHCGTVQEEELLVTNINKKPSENS